MCLLFLFLRSLWWDIFSLLVPPFPSTPVTINPPSRLGSALQPSATTTTSTIIWFKPNSHSWQGPVYFNFAWHKLFRRFLVVGASPFDCPVYGRLLVPDAALFTCLSHHSIETQQSITKHPYPADILLHLLLFFFSFVNARTIRLSFHGGFYGLRFCLPNRRHGYTTTRASGSNLLVVHMLY